MAAAAPDKSVDLHPIAAALAKAITRSDDGKSVSLPDAAVESARAALRLADDDAVVHLIALAVKTRRIAGEGALPVIVAIGFLVGDKLGSKQAAADRFADAGMASEAKALLASTPPVRAPQADHKPATPTVKARRGLKKD